MTEYQKVWILFFSGVVSIRFHPRNVVHGDASGDFINCELDFCKKVADAMWKVVSDKFGQGSLQ